jgi:hypothetical protein
MSSLTVSQIERQDIVDNSIYDLINKINPSQQGVEWNIEMIGEIRDLIQIWLVDHLAITDEKSFYPFIDSEG